MRVLKFFFILVSTFLIVSFVMNKSIISYLEQRYHIYISLDNDILNEANAFKNKLEQIKTVISDDPFNKNYEILVELARKKESNASLETEQFLSISGQNFQENIQNNNADENLSEQNNSVAEIKIDTNLTVKDDEEFLIIGDSLMQGVALSLVRDLKALGIDSINLSKQNTGLSYKSYFDWAKATEAAFLSNNKIKYLVVLLGANDPWAIKQNNKYHAFNSDEWLKIYKNRVNEIIQIAKQNKTKVIWYEIPPVKDKNLNSKIQVLNKIYEEISMANKEIFIPTKDSFSENGEYSSYVKDENNKSVKVRADDGTHFNVRGARIMSNLLLKHINK